MKAAASAHGRSARHRWLSWLALSVLAFAGMARAAPLPLLHDGDLLFQTSRSAQSVAIQQATGSRWSHVGVAVYRDGQPYVLEAEANVRFTPLATWIARGQGGHYAVRRLRDSAPVDTPAAHVALRRWAAGVLGRPYDDRFAWSDQRLYCSELVWKLYRNAYGLTLAPLAHWRDFRLDSPEVRQRMRERFGGAPPPDEPLIAPDGLYRSPLLVTVAEG